MYTLENDILGRYMHGLEPLSAFAKLSKELKVKYGSNRRPILWHVLYWLDLYGPLTPVQMSELSNAKYSYGDLNRVCAYLRKRGEVTQDYYDRNKDTVWRRVAS